MPPQESTALLRDGTNGSSSPPPPPPPLPHPASNVLPSHYSFGSGDDDYDYNYESKASIMRRRCSTCWSRHRVGALGLGTMLVLAVVAFSWSMHNECLHPSQPGRVPNATTTVATGGGVSNNNNQTGPYRLIERQVGGKLFDYYDFLDGPDSLGSAGYNVYVGRDRAHQLNLVTVERDDDNNDQSKEYVYIRSSPSSSSSSTSSGNSSGSGPRESIRLEGKQRFDRGLFVLDVAHMPSGCGVWPAFWLTDEENWPNHGEIDVVEGVNQQTVAKTALHTSESCSMYAHVPDYAHTGIWDSATGIPNTWTGLPDYNTSVPADNCWVMAPHQWANQGCVAISTVPDTIGQPFNERGGGVYALEWDPANRYIKSWVFPVDLGLPDNLQAAMDSASASSSSSSGSSLDDVIRPDPDTWGLPYAYFSIGETTGCSADHFQNHRLIFNLAFCGNVAGNRFLNDCPNVAKQFLVLDQNGNPDPVATCNAYIGSNPKELDDAFWKVRGVYVYQRE